MPITYKNKILTNATTTPGQRGLGSKFNEGILYTPQISRIEASPPDAV